MGANRFMKPVKADYFQTYVNQYVPQPFELMQRAVDNKQKRQDAVNANLEALQTSWGKMKAHSGMDTKQLRDIEKYYMDRTQEILSKGDLTSSEQDVRMLGRAMSEDTELLDLLQGAKKEQDYFEWLKETEQHAIGEGGLSRQRRSYEEALHRRHQEIGIAGTGGDILTRTYKTSPDLEALANDYASTMKSSTVEDWAGIYTRDEIDGIHKFLDRNYEELEATDIEKGSMLSLLNNSDAVEELEARARYNKSIEENKNILDVQIDQSDIYNEAIKAVAPSRIAYAFKKGDTKANLIKAAGYDTKYAEVPNGLFAYKTEFTVNAPGGVNSNQFKTSYANDVVKNEGIKNTLGTVLKEIYYDDPLVKNANKTNLSAILKKKGFDLDDVSLVNKIKMEIRYGKGIGYGLTKNMKTKYLKLISDAVIYKNRLIERNEDSDKYAFNSISTDMQNDLGLSPSELQDEIRENILNKLTNDYVKNPFAELKKIDDAFKLGGASSKLLKIRYLHDNYGLSEEDAHDMVMSDVFDKYTTAVDTYEEKFVKYKNKRLDDRGSIDYVMHVSNGNDLPQVSRKGKLVNGDVILDEFRENYLIKGALYKTPILDTKGLPVEYPEGVTNNNQYILSKLNEGLDDKDKLTKIPQPSGAMIGVNPLNGSAVVTLQYGQDTANPVETVISLNDFISQAGITKTEEYSWRAKLTLQGAMKTGVLSSMYDNYGNLVEDEDGDKLMSTGEGTFIIRNKKKVDSAPMEQSDALSWLARYYNKLN